MIYQKGDIVILGRSKHKNRAEIIEYNLHRKSYLVWRADREKYSEVWESNITEKIGEKKWKLYWN